jgi:HAD superfamily hydrolase (TIGR01509 family)
LRFDALGQLGVAAVGLSLHDLEVHAVVFDFDGVLADTTAGWARTEYELCAAYRVTYTDELAVATHGAGIRDAVALLTASAKVPVPSVEAELLMRELALEHVLGSAQALNGAARALELIGQRVPVAVASNSERPLLELLLSRTGLASLVDVVVSASDVGFPKPAPDVYLEATRRLRVDPRGTLVVEDSATGLAAAKAAGCVLVSFGPLAVERGAGATLPATTVRDHDDLLEQLDLLH